MCLQTGYQNPTQSYYELPDGSAVPKGSPDIKYCLKIKDGSRIGSQNGEMIYGGVYFETSDIDNAPEYFQNITACMSKSFRNRLYANLWKTCKILGVLIILLTAHTAFQIRLFSLLPTISLFSPL